MTKNNSDNDNKLANIAIRQSLKNKLKNATSGQRASMGQVAEILIENFLTEVEQKGFFMPEKYNRSISVQ